MNSTQNKIEMEKCPEGHELSACATCTHKCPMATAMEQAPVPWWVWTLFAVGVIAVGYGIKLLVQLFV